MDEKLAPIRADIQAMKADIQTLQDDGAIMKPCLTTLENNFGEVCCTVSHPNSFVSNI